MVAFSFNFCHKKNSGLCCQKVQGVKFNQWRFYCFIKWYCLLFYLLFWLFCFFSNMADFSHNFHFIKFDLKLY